MLLLPATLVLLAVQVYPITNTLLLSFNSYNLLRPDRGIVRRELLVLNQHDEVVLEAD